MAMISIRIPPIMKALFETLKFRISLASGLLAAAGYRLGNPSLAGFWLSLFGTALVVASACAFNMILEADTDAMMPRTRNRPLPSGRIKTIWVFLAALFTGLGGLWMLSYQHLLGTLLATAALILYAFVYTPLKRRSVWAFLAGIVPGAAPPLIGWTSATGHFSGAGLGLFLFLLLWQFPHIFALYTCLASQYRMAKIPLPNALWGEQLTHRLGIGMGLLSLTMLPMLYPALGLIWVVAIGVVTLWLLRIGFQGFMREPDLVWANRFKRATLAHLGLTTLLLSLGAWF